MKFFFGTIMAIYSLVAILLMSACDSPTSDCPSESTEMTRFVNYSVVDVYCYDEDADTILWKYRCDTMLDPEYADTVMMEVPDNIRIITETPIHSREQVISPVVRGRDYQISPTGMWSLIKE